MDKRQKHYKQWLLQAPLGLVLIGMGVCFISESAMLKYRGAATWDWVLAGTGSLVVFNSGLCVFGNAIIHRVRFLLP